MKAKYWSFVKISKIPKKKNSNLRFGPCCSVRLTSQRAVGSRTLLYLHQDISLNYTMNSIFHKSSYSTIKLARIWRSLKQKLVFVIASRLMEVDWGPGTISRITLNDTVRNQMEKLTDNLLAQ